MPLAHAVLDDRYSAPPLVLIAAWKCVYWNDDRELTRIAYEAAGGGAA